MSKANKLGVLLTMQCVFVVFPSAVYCLFVLPQFFLWLVLGGSGAWIVIDVCTYLHWVQEEHRMMEAPCLKWEDEPYA